MFNALNKTISVIDDQERFPSLKKHYMDKVDYWTLSGWREDDVGSYLRKGDIIDRIENLERELASDIENKRNTTPRPSYLQCEMNILTLIGLTESAKRDTGQVSTTINWISLGTSSTAESENDTGLGAEDSGAPYARKQLSVDGSRKVTNQTAKYGVLFDDGDISSVPKSINEAGLHWASSGSSNIHSRVTFTTFSFTTGDLFVVQINELHQNGSS